MNVITLFSSGGVCCEAEKINVHVICLGVSLSGPPLTKFNVDFEVGGVGRHQRLLVCGRIHY